MLSRGKFPNDMIRVIASSLRELHRAGLLVTSNRQKFISAELDGHQKLVLRLEDMSVDKFDPVTS
jgi:hypothetical protein